MPIRFPDRLVQILTEAPAEIQQWVNMVNAPLVWPYTQGEGVVGAIIDTGIDLEHSDLKNNIIDAVSLIDDTPQDDHGHGSHVSGIAAATQDALGIVGIAPKAKLLSIKCIPASGQGINLPIPEAVEYAINWRGPNGEQVRAINMSLGMENSPKLYTAIKKAVSDAGILLVAASGNDGDGNPATIELSFPAAYWEAVSVGALDMNGPMADFSNSNDTIDFIAPGVNIKSCYKDGAYAVWSGTSMSSPIIFALAMLIISGFEKILKRRLTEPEIFYALQKRTRNLGFDKRLQGSGMVDMSLYLDEFITGPAPMPKQPEVYLVIMGDTQVKASESQSEAETFLRRQVDIGEAESGHIERYSDRKIVYTYQKTEKPPIGTIYLTGKSVLTAEQMEQYVIQKADHEAGLARLYLQEGEIEGIRGDIAYCQDVTDTLFFKFEGEKYGTGKNNFGKLHREYNTPLDVSFPDARTGVRARIQHYKAGANTQPLRMPCVDPYFNDVPRGSRPTLESLSGTWHIPGYNPNVYKSLARAIESKDAYHHWVLQRYSGMLDINVPPGYVAPNPFGDIELPPVSPPEKPVEPPVVPPVSKRILPVKNAVVTNIYGVKGEAYKAKGYHSGIDFIGDSDILSTDPGTVLEIGWDPTGWGTNVIVKTAEHEIIYAHLASVSVSQGQTVQAGTKLGVMGSSGNSTGIHLHYEVRKPPYRAGNEVNPAKYFGIKNEEGPVQEVNKLKYLVVYGGHDDGAAKMAAYFLHCPIQHVKDFEVNPTEAGKRFMIGGLEKPAPDFVLITGGSGTGRVETMQAVIDYFKAFKP